MPPMPQKQLPCFGPARRIYFNLKFASCIEGKAKTLQFSCRATGPPPWALRKNRRQGRPKGPPWRHSLSKNLAEFHAAAAKISEICFSRRHVRREKHLSARKRASCQPAAVFGAPRKLSEAVCVGRGGARKRSQFSPLGRNGEKRTLRRRSALPRAAAFFRKSPWTFSKVSAAGGGHTASPCGNPVLSGQAI